MRRWQKRLLFLGVTILFLMLFPSPSHSQSSGSNTPTVTVEIGPTFGNETEDKNKVNNCVTAYLQSRFPFDFIAKPLSDRSGACPTLEIFNNVYEACFIVEIYEKIRPAIVGGLTIYAIFHL